MFEKWMDAPRHMLVEQAAAHGRGDDLSDGMFVGLMAGSCVSVWAVSGGIYYLSQKKKQEQKTEGQPLVATEETAETETTGGAVGVSSLSVLLSIPALFAH